MAVVVTTASAFDNGGHNHKQPLPKGIKAKDLKIKRGATIDSMSYTMGTNMGLTVSLGHIANGITLDTDVIRYAALETYASQSIDEKVTKEVGQLLNDFQYERIFPYLTAKRGGEEELPQLYDEKFTIRDISNAMGFIMGYTLCKAHFDIDIAWVIRGFNDALPVATEEDFNTMLLLSGEEMREQYKRIQQIEQEAAAAELERQKAENARLSEEWLAEVEKMEGVNKCESGLLYRIDRIGTGDYPIYDTDKVNVHYKGTLRNGDVFDSSYERGQSIIFGLHQVIKGWTEGIKYINEGGKITLWIPANLAYGERGAGEDIGPNMAIKFEVELLEVVE